MASTSPSVPQSAPSSPHNVQRRPRILVGVTGSVAAVKVPEITLRLVRELKAQVKILLSSAGRHFWEKAADYDDHKGTDYWDQLKPLLVTEGTMKENDLADHEWRDWHRIGDPVLHIDLRDWADVFLIAPLSAHTLAKISHGLCDDTVTCVARAWDMGRGSRPGKPLLLAPAMNTAMWDHPLTQAQLDTIVSFGSRSMAAPSSGGVVRVIPPLAKTLACGEIGVGALANVDDIIQIVGWVFQSEAFKKQQGTVLIELEEKLEMLLADLEQRWRSMQSELSVA